MKLSQQTTDTLKEQGYSDLDDYLMSLSTDYGVPVNWVVSLAEMLGRKIEVSQYITYALRHGDYPSLGIYHVREVKENSIKAHKLNESYGDAARYSLMWPLANGMQVIQKYIVRDRGSPDRKPGYRE